MAAALILGSEDPVLTGKTIVESDKTSGIETYEGRVEDLEAFGIVPGDASEEFSGMTVERVEITPTGDGFGKMNVHCVEYGSSEFSVSAQRTTMSVDMCEVVKDLQDHPKLASSRDVITKWLATDEAKRVSGGTYYYVDESETSVEIEDAAAIKFCNAYMAGIKTYNQYFPVITKTGYWKRLPGASMSGNSIIGGTPTFSTVGTFETPPISLTGYPATNWFKSKDSWEQDATLVWRRVEQWTYTPDGSAGTHAWIYNDSSIGNE